jgi:o-succinylbenzoate synthase
MKIKDILLTKRYIKFKHSYGISSATFNGETFLILKLIGEDGTFGLADSVTAIPFGYEDVDTMLHIIRKYLSQAIIGKDSLDIEAIGTNMERATPGHPMAKAAIDIALYDLNAKTLGLSVYQLVGGKFRNEIRLGGAIGISDTERMIREAHNLIQKGCKDIKIKIGRDPLLDLERVKEIRLTIGSEPHLFVDGNQGCNLSEYLPVFQKMEKYDLAFIEQPLPIWDIGGYQKLCAKLDTPILIDEGVYTPNDLMTLIKYQAADAVNIKILKTGLTGGKKIAAIAESAGLPCHLGSMFETGIGTAASIHFAISTRSISNSSECFFPTLLAEDVIEGDIYSTMPESWTWGLPQDKGLGISLKPEIDSFLESYKNGNDQEGNTRD